MAGEFSERLLNMEFYQSQIDSKDDDLMNSKQRMQAAMHLQTPDRVPVMCQLSHGHIFRVLRPSPSQFYFNAHTMAESFAAMRELYGFDGVLVNNIHTTRTRDFLQQARVEKREEGEWVYLPDGSYYRCPYNDEAVFISQQPLPEIDDVEVEPLPVVTEIDDYRVEPQRLLVEWSKGEYSVHGETVSPFDWLVILMGVENTMMALLLDPEKCHRLLAHYLPQSLAFAKKQIDVGVDAMKISSPFVGSSFISKELYAQFVAPYEKQLVTSIHAYAPDIPVYTHTCGFIGDRLELMQSTGINGIECLDPPPLGDVDLADAKRRIGDRMFIKGNMDSVNHLLNATPESLEAYVKSVLAQGMPGGGYILSTACSVSPGVSPEVLKLLVPLAEQYGRY